MNADNLNRDTKTRTPSYYLFSLPNQESGTHRKRWKKRWKKVYHWTIELPDWARPAVQWALDHGICKGAAADDLDLTETQVKTLVFMYRDNERKGTL